MKGAWLLSRSSLLLGFLFCAFLCLESRAAKEGDSEKVTRSEVVDVYSPLKPYTKVGILKPHTRVKVLVTFAPRGYTEVLVQDELLRPSRVLVRTRDLEDAPLDLSDEVNDPKDGEIDHAKQHNTHHRKKIEHPWSFGAGLSGYSSSVETRIQVSGDLRYLWNLANETLLGLDVNFGLQPSVGVRGGERYYFWPESQLRPYIHAGIRVFDVRFIQSSAFDPGFGVQFIHTKGAFVELGANFLWATPFDRLRPNMWLFGGSSGLRF